MPGLSLKNYIDFVNLRYVATLMSQIAHEMWRRKLRSFLALFCIAWGTLTIIMLLALGQGFQKANEKSVMRTVDGAFTFYPSVTSKVYRGLPKGRDIRIYAKDVMALSGYIPQITGATPLFSKGVNITVKGKQMWRSVGGVSSDIFKIRKITLDTGRTFNVLDEINCSHVIILGYKLKTVAFGDKNAIGRKIYINQVPFLVVGVLQNSKIAPKAWYDNGAIVPYTTYIKIWGNSQLSSFLLAFDPNTDIDKVKQDVITFLAYKYSFDRNDRDAVAVYSNADMVRFMEWFFFGIKIFLGICGALTLGVGSLGVANIMFLIVAERTREIGLRKALGAYDWHISMQILAEALSITVLGGIAGFIVAYLMVSVLQQLPLPEWLGKPTLSWLISLITVVVLSVMGVVSGYFPARRAVLMDPIDALKL